MSGMLALGMRNASTFDRMTRLNVSGLAGALVAAVIGVVLWRAGLDVVVAVAAAFGAGSTLVFGWDARHSGVSARPLGALGFYAAWTVLVGPIAWLVASSAW